MSELAKRAHGRWRGILSELGADRKWLSGKHQPCPFCGGTDRFRWTDHKGTGAFFCGQCGTGDGVEFIRRWKAVEFRQAAELIESVVGIAERDAPQRARSDDAMKRDMEGLWRAGKPIAPGSVVDAYLAGRGLQRPSYPACLRGIAHPSMTGMLAQVVGPDGRRAVQVHRTFLTAEGKKADIPRKLMPGEFPAGSAIRLAPVDGAMGIAEGIETALSAEVLFGIPVWAAVNAGNLAVFRPPERVRRLVVFGDNDLSFAGQAAAYAAAKAVAAKGVDVAVEIPPTVGDDWNDVLRRRGELA